jgi:hypothetical protein
MGRVGVTLALVATGASVVLLIVATISAGSHLAAPRGSRTASGAVDLRVSAGFGHTVITSGSRERVPATTSVLSFTRRFTPVTATGGTVTAIAGHPAGARGRWFLYVNGIAAAMGPRATSLTAGDQVWWDLHDAGAIPSPAAVVGSYPEPFTNGSGGQSYPTVVTCAEDLTRACNTVTRSLAAAGVKVSFQALGTGSGSDSLAVLVGTFRQLELVIASELLSGGPAKSGVFATYTGSRAQVVELDDAAGQTVQTLAGSVGLIAATEQEGLNEPVWLITGTNPAGVDAAARALTRAKLAGRFAAAVLPGGRVVSLPVPAGA